MKHTINTAPVADGPKEVVVTSSKSCQFIIQFHGANDYRLIFSSLPGSIPFLRSEVHLWKFDLARLRDLINSMLDGATS